MRPSVAKCFTPCHFEPVPTRALLASLAFLIPVAAAKGQPLAFRGCYGVTVGDWTPRMAGDSIYHRIPRSIVLDTTRKGPGFAMNPDIAYPRSNRFPMTPRWEASGDTLILTWSNGFSPTVVRLTRGGQELVGEAIALSDYHPIPEPPRPRAPVRLTRTSCYQDRRDEYRRTLTARDKGGETVRAAHDSALRDLESLLRPLVGDFTAPWIAGRGRINVQTLLPGDQVSGLPDGMLYQSRDSTIQVLVTTHDLMASWIEWLFSRDTIIPRDPRLALGNEDVLTQVFDVNAHVFTYTDIPVDSAPPGIIAAMLVARSQDYSPQPANELLISVERGTRIFIIDAPAAVTIPIPPRCAAAADSGRARSGTLVDSAYRTRPPDGTLLERSFRNSDVTNAAFRRCYGELVAREPQFRELVAQVRRLVETLPW